jgi:hypothetical protein
MRAGSVPGNSQYKISANPAETPSRPHRPASLVQRPLPIAIDWLVYAGMVSCSIIAALVGTYNVDADTTAYLDLSNAVRNHQWHALVNASWFPTYPALLTIGRACFRFRPQYDIMAARLVDCVINLLLVLAYLLFAATVRRLVIARGVTAERLLPPRSLYLWAAIFAYFFISQDLIGIKPDSFVSLFLILAITALLWGLVRIGPLPYIAAGLCGGLAFAGKAFAFPLFVLLLLLVGCANLRRYRVLAGLLVSLAVFVLVTGPFVRQISVQKGRLTIGDSGRLNTAWYVNGADRLNPVSDPSVYHRGDALGSFLHPGELLAHDPEISYYGGDKVYGSTPQWDDFSYWSDGLHSRFVLHETIATLVGNCLSLVFTLTMRVQAFLLIAALVFGGFSIRKQSIADPTLLVIPMLALAAIISVASVHLETRYIVFGLILVGVLFASCAVTSQPLNRHRSLHLTFALAASLILAGSVENSLKQMKTALAEGAQPLKGIYSAPVLAAGESLAALYPRGTEVACLGDSACWGDPLWAEYAGVKMTAIIETGPGGETKSATQGCGKIEQNPAALEPLRQHHIKAIIARFEQPFPCSPAWKPLEDSRHFFYLAL